MSNITDCQNCERCKGLVVLLDNARAINRVLINTITLQILEIARLERKLKI